MGGCSFVFIFVKQEDPPDPTQRGPEDKVTWGKVVPYAHMRHSDISERHWVWCVRDALDIIVRVLDERNCPLDQVHVYTHGSAGGEFWGRLSSPKEDYRAIGEQEASLYRLTELRISVIAKHATRLSEVHIHGCHLGRSQSAVITWRDIFGATSGVASAPKEFQIFLDREKLLLPAYEYPKKSGKLIDAGNPEVLNETQFNAYVDKVAEEVKRRAGTVWKDAAEKKVKTDYNKLLDDYLYSTFKELIAGEELPWDGVNKMRKPEAILEMRRMFRLTGQAFRTCLSYLPLDEIKFPTTMGRKETIKRKLEKQGITTVWPYEKGRWRDWHLWVPCPPAPRLILGPLD
jgi:hypothetical protein